MAISNIDQLKKANSKKGHFWFDNASYYGSKVVTGLLHGRYFVESGYREAGEPDSGTAYWVAEFDQDGGIKFLGHTRTLHDTIDEAIAAADAA